MYYLSISHLILVSPGKTSHMWLILNIFVGMCCTALVAKFIHLLNDKSSIYLPHYWQRSLKAAWPSFVVYICNLGILSDEESSVFQPHQYKVDVPLRAKVSIAAQALWRSQHYVYLGWPRWSCAFQVETRPWRRSLVF